MNYREKMREYLKEPNEICNHYGKWGILNKEQRNLITRLLNEMDGADNYIIKLQQENARLKEKINKANILTKKIKDDVWAKMAECYENEDNWNGDFLNIEINSIDRLLEMLKEN